jgi:hypothetical protein
MYFFCGLYVVYKVVSFYDIFKDVSPVNQSLCSRTEVGFEVEQLEVFQGHVLMKQHGTGTLWGLDLSSRQSYSVKHWEDSYIADIAVSNSSLLVLASSQARVRLLTYTLSLSPTSSQLELSPLSSVSLPDYLVGLVGSVAPRNSTHIYLSTVRAHVEDGSTITAAHNWFARIFKKQSHIYSCSLEVSPAVCSKVFSSKHLVSLNWDGKVLFAADHTYKQLIQLKVKQDGSLKIKYSTTLPMSPNDVFYDLENEDWYIAGTAKPFEGLYSKSLTGRAVLLMKPQKKYRVTDLLTQRLLNSTTSLVKVGESLVLASKDDTALLVCAIAVVPVLPVEVKEL